MNCENIETLILADLRGVISSQDKARLHEHLANCSACDKAYSEAKWADDGLALLNVKAPAGLAEKARKRAGTSGKASGDKRKKDGLMGRILAFPPVYRYSLAGLAAAAVFILLLMPEGSKDSTETRNPETRPFTAAISKDPGPSGTHAKPAAADDAKAPSTVGPAAVEVCTVSTLNGTVEVMLPNSPWATATRALGIPVDGRVRTGEGSSAKLSFPGMADLVIKPSSEIVVKHNGLSLKNGSTWIRVTKRNSRFEVTTPQAIMGVLGTEFGVAVTPGRGTLLEVFEGRVGMSAAEGQADTRPEGIDAKGFTGFQIVVESGKRAMVTPDSTVPHGFTLPPDAPGSQARRDLWRSSMAGVIAEIPAAPAPRETDWTAADPVGSPPPKAELTVETEYPRSGTIGTEGLIRTMDSDIEEE